MTDRTFPPPSLPHRVTAHMLAVLLLGTSASALADDAVSESDLVRGIENDAANIKTDVTNIDETLKAAVLRERRFPLDKRFVDAQIAYDRGNLSVSSVLLTDLVTNPEFQKSRD